VDGYRLPTEAEREYACRAGTTTPFSTGDNITTDQANYNGDSPYKGNAKGEYRGKTTLAGSFAPNPWGLYDMHGNVEEWCWDWHKQPYTGEAQKDPEGPERALSDEYRVVRGGSWTGKAMRSRSADRRKDVPFCRGITTWGSVSCAQKFSGAAA